MADNFARPVLDWSGSAPFPFTRESSIRLDAEGRFFHEGSPVDHPGLARAMASWISRHPDNGRWVLENGYDWCYVTIDDVPLWVRSAHIEGDTIVGTLSDGSEERIDPASLTIDDAGTLRCEVKASARRGPYPAKLARHAQLALGDRIREDAGRVVLAMGSGDVDVRKHASVSRA
jgi:uncharacterized protein